MTLRGALLFLYAETPVHAGGDAASGVVDLPIQREVATELPIIKGESLKGALREHFRPRLDEDEWLRIFGSEPPTGGGTTTPGSLRVHEAQLLAFPTPTLEATFAWLTSPLARARLDRKAGLAGTRVRAEEAPAAGPPPDDTVCVAARPHPKGMVLGQYPQEVRQDDELASFAGALAETALPDGDGHDYLRDKLRSDLICGTDALLTAISKDCAPLVARVQLGKPDGDGEPTKTVQHGPFYSEYLPGESLLVALLEGREADLAALEVLDGGVLRVGGDESIGKGLMWCRLLMGSEAG